MAEWVAQACERIGPDHADVLERALLEVLPRFEGAFSLVLMDRHRVIGVRDPQGFRPLCLGKLDSGWVLASESPALDIVGAHFVRELEPGEMVIIDADRRSLDAAVPGRRWSIPKLCLFEFVYFARPDAQLYGQNVHQARVRMGEQLADQAPVDGGHGDRRARVGHPRRRGLRPAVRHPVRPRAWSRTATSAAPSSPRARRCVRSASA